MIERTATNTQATVIVAKIRDGAARHLTLAHLRAFVEQADLAAIPDETRVMLTDELQETSHWHTVEIVAEVRSSDTAEIVTPGPED